MQQLTVSRKGVADEILAKRDEERGRKRDVEEVSGMDDGRDPIKRARSVSSSSMSSVSTISTNRSRTESPARRQSYDGRDRRMSSRPPSPRYSTSRKRRYSDSPSSYSSDSSRSRSRSRSRNISANRNTRRRRRESSPNERGRSRTIDRQGGLRDRSRSNSVERSRIARTRRSRTPADAGRSEYPDADRRSSDRRSNSPPLQSAGRRHPQQQAYDDRTAPTHGSMPSRRERSLSPYSKRLALTQAMGMQR